MRYSVTNGNGCKCDRCGKILHPSQAIKIKALQLFDSTGTYKVINKKDLCKSCYIKMFSEI